MKLQTLVITAVIITIALSSVSHADTEYTCNDQKNCELTLGTLRSIHQKSPNPNLEKLFQYVQKQKDEKKNPVASIQIALFDEGLLKGAVLTENGDSIEFVTTPSQTIRQRVNFRIDESLTVPQIAKNENAAKTASSGSQNRAGGSQR